MKSLRPKYSKGADYSRIVTVIFALMRIIINCITLNSISESTIEMELAILFAANLMLGKIWGSNLIYGDSYPNYLHHQS